MRQCGDVRRLGRSLLTCGYHGDVQLHGEGPYSMNTPTAAAPAVLCSQRAHLQEHRLVLHRHPELGATFWIRAASRSEGQSAGPPLCVDPADCQHDDVTGIVSANWNHIRLMTNDLMNPFSRFCRGRTVSDAKPTLVSEAQNWNKPSAALRSSSSCCRKQSLLVPIPAEASLHESRREL